MSARPLDAAAVAERLGFAPGTQARRWVDELEKLGPPPPALAPAPLEAGVAAERLAWLGVPDEDASDVLATLPSPDRAPEWWWCLEREVHRVASTMGEPDAERGTWPAFEGPSEPLDRRCHFVHAALSVVPFTLAHYAELGVPEDIVRDSLADVARHMGIHRRVHGATGVDAAWWVTLCLRAEIVDLGRLQYNRFSLGIGDESPLWYPEDDAAAFGPGFRPGDPCLGVHIPEGSPLSPELVGESLGRAARFFAEHDPVDQRRVATCMSWLLDDQLAEYLPAESNIVSFHRRFELVPGWFDGDGEVLQFVFRVAGDWTDFDALPQRSRLERAAVAHLRAGRHWRMRTGWLDLPGD